MDWSNIPPLNALRAFAAVAETRSLTKAAEALNVTRPAVSQQIRNLESHLNESLLVRGRRGVILTPRGEALAHSVQAAFADIADAAQQFSISEASRALHVTTTPMFASSFLVPRLAAFRSAHPGIELMLNPTCEFIDPSPGGIDMAIRYGTGDWPGVDCELLFVGCFAVVAATSLIGDREFTEPGQIMDYPLLLELGYKEFADWMTSQGLDVAEHKNVTRMPGNLLLDGLRRGEGIVATVPRFIEQDIKAGHIRVLFTDRETAGYYLLTRPGVQRRPLRTFIRWLKSTM
ncbi:HTH-type transcriptional activator AmpR [Roseovarius albus]|uniref:HTH-type transcriptional activator AmpR n=1 Tax=Roseovarius albus TaxID=1247867 RepID=A0A1X6Y9V3_9RHOB|nr:LysR family transcriptional regulator [Roseovarius albus]SLN13180.1 HTH-type transcriptional activator AmpR [Roseovarius albus]